MHGLNLFNDFRLACAMEVVLLNRIIGEAEILFVGLSAEAILRDLLNELAGQAKLTANGPDFADEKGLNRGEIPCRIPVFR